MFLPVAARPGKANININPTQAGTPPHTTPIFMNYETLGRREGREGREGKVLKQLR